MYPIVDVHCHTFNADDVPVHGFLQRVVFRGHPLTDNISALVDLAIQSAAPGYEAESARLDALLPAAAPAPELIAEAAAVDLDAEVQQAMLRVEQAAPGLIRSLGWDLTATDVATDPDAAEGVLDWYDAARRAVAWATLFAKQRIDITAALLANFAGRISLCTPMLVDLGMGLQDTAKTTMRQQMELHEKISRLSMRGRLPGSQQSHVHPFVGFDPRRELRARQIGAIEGPLDVVHDAVTRYGFVGVKLYPPMGFLPLGNADSADVPDGLAIDGILREFYTWCVAEDVPVTAHCAPSAYARKEYRDFTAPEHWEAVLTEFPGLHLNLGHFGGIDDLTNPEIGWQWKIARLAGRFPHLYADVGNHKIYDATLRQSYFAMLAKMYADQATEAMSERLMYGSDWYMRAIQPEHESFLRNFEQHYHEAFGAARTEQFMGRNALRFLGFDDVGNRNNKRLRDRYRTYAGADQPGWLAVGTPGDAGSAEPLESLPDQLVAAVEVRDAWRRQAASLATGMEFLVSDLTRWPPGSTVRVGFLDGDTALHADIAAATEEITAACNLTLDFGHDEQAGTFRRWTEHDIEHAAEVRVSFDRDGYWSLVGTDSTDPVISSPAEGIGGGPGQRSLNLGGFAEQKPPTWRRTVLHEFLHALSFQHAHQNMRGPCEAEFRWDDDDGYVPTQNADGVFGPDAQGRRPGIYTYLAGPPNNWPKAKVDHNLRTAESPDTVAGPFDTASVMLYRFAPFFYQHDPSDCAPSGDGTGLSDGDKRGLQLLYPHTEQAIADLAQRSTLALDTFGGRPEAAPDSGAEDTPASRYEQRAIALLQGLAG